MKKASSSSRPTISHTRAFLSLFTAINKMAKKYDMPILYSCPPRSRNRLEASDFRLDRRVIRHEPLGFHDYNHLQMNAFAVVSASGTLPEESSFLHPLDIRFPQSASVPVRNGRKRWIRRVLCWPELMRNPCCRRWIPRCR